jgi:hypothetical protein
MDWYSEKLELLRRMPASQLLLFVTVKFLAGVALGLLLAVWLPTWIWWIILVVSLLIGIPLYIKIFK